MNKIFLLFPILCAAVMLSCKKENLKENNNFNDLTVGNYSEEFKIRQFEALQDSLSKEITSNLSNYWKEGGNIMKTKYHPPFYTDVQELENQLNTDKVVAIKKELMQLASDLKEVYPDWSEENPKVLVHIREDFSVLIRH